MWNNIKTVANIFGTIFGIAAFYTWAYDRGRQSLINETGDVDGDAQEKQTNHRVVRNGDVITIDLSDLAKQLIQIGKGVYDNYTHSYFFIKIIF